jgi:hypothetical protein
MESLLFAFYESSALTVTDLHLEHTVDQTLVERLPVEKNSPQELHRVPFRELDNSLLKSLPNSPIL